MRLGDIAKKSSLKLKMISEEELVDLHKVLLLMLDDLIEICKRNNLHFILIGGSAIGALRDVLFGVVALICAYYLFKPEKRMTRSFKILLASAVGLIVLYLLSFSVPEISAIFERFSHIGSDEESNTRFMMWALALKNFKENPLIGIGWNGYKYQFYHFLYNPAVRAERYAYLNAHNVYLQLLCETGILGFLIFMSGAIELFVRTLKLLKKNIRDSFSIGSKGTIFFVLTMQIFFWLYSLTGNCLYDTMFGFYSVSIGFVLGYLVQKKNIKEEIYNEKDRNINIS